MRAGGVPGATEKSVDSGVCPAVRPWEALPLSGSQQEEDNGSTYLTGLLRESNKPFSSLLYSQCLEWLKERTRITRLGPDQEHEAPHGTCHYHHWLPCPGFSQRLLCSWHGSRCLARSGK